MKSIKTLLVIAMSLSMSCVIFAQSTQTISDGQGGRIAVNMDASGNLKVNVAASVGNSTVAIDQTTPGTTNGVVVNSSALPTGAATSDLQTSGNSSLTTIATNTTNAGTPTIAAGTNQIGKVGYTLKMFSTQFTRPSNTIAYVVGQAVTNSTSAPSVFTIDLSGFAVNGQSIEIRKVAVVSSAAQTTLPLFNVYLSGTTFDATNDGSAMSIPLATMQAGGAWFLCDIQNTAGVCSRCTYLSVPMPMILDAANNKLYGTIQAANAYTPISGETFTVIIWAALL